MSIVEDLEKLICEVERRTPCFKKLKVYSEINQKLWNEVCESVATKWSELPAEQKSEQGKLIFLLILLGFILILIYWAETYIL